MMGGLNGIFGGYWGVGDILVRNARVQPSDSALIFGSRSGTWRETNARVNALARLLRAKGVAQGDRVGLLELYRPKKHR